MKHASFASPPPASPLWVFSIFLPGVFLNLFCSGCGPGFPETADVSGRVTYAGKPVPEGRVLFWPEEGRPAMGEINPDGTYHLTTFAEGDGATPGTHKVTIKATRVHFPGGGASSPEAPGAPGRPIVEWLVPERYEQVATSPLTVDVQPGENTVDFDLPAE